ncbi:hypothetical protein GCM10018966_072680 [Streptomyces yanii]
MRAAVLRERPFGPQGGLPERVRVDQGKDFLSRTVTAAFNALDVSAYTPHLKGTVEGVNRAVESMFLAALPAYVRQPRPGRGRRVEGRRAGTSGGGRCQVRSSGVVSRRRPA